MGLTDAPENVHAGDEAQSDQSGRRTPAERPTRELLKSLGFSSFWQLVGVLALEIAAAWFVLVLATALVSDDLPAAMLWQRLQVLFLSRPTTLAFLFVLATAVAVPTFIWFQVSFMWILILWRRWRASQAQRSAE